MIQKKKIFFLIYITMLEITRKNCYKCDLETIIDNNSLLDENYWSDNELNH